MSNDLDQKYSTICSNYCELIKEGAPRTPYDYQVQALIPMFERLGYSQDAAVSDLKEWAVQDRLMLYWMGCCSTEDIETMWHLVKAGRCLCGMNHTGAIQMLQETIRLIKEKHPLQSRKFARACGFDCQIKGLPPADDVVKKSASKGRVTAKKAA